MPDAAHTTHKLRHDAEILVLVQGVDTQHVEDVAPVLGVRVAGVAAALEAAATGGAGPPFGLLGGGEVVRGVDVAWAEPAVEVAFEVGGAVGGFGFGEGGAPGGGGGGLGLGVAAYGGDEAFEVADGCGVLLGLGVGGLWWWGRIWRVR